MPKSIHVDHHDTAYYIPMYHRTQGFNEHDREIYKSLERQLFHEGRVIDPSYLGDQPNLCPSFAAIRFDCLLDINEKICPVFILQFYKSVCLIHSFNGTLSIAIIIHNVEIILRFEEFARILHVPSLIEDWVSDSDEENVPKVKTVEMFNKSSFAKINFVKSTEQVKSSRKISIDKNRQNTPSLRGNKRNWNQKLEPTNNDCKNWYNNGRSAKPVWTNVQRVNKQNFSKLTHPSPRRNMVPRTVLTSSSNFTKKVNTVKGTRVNTARPKAVISAVKGNKGNVVKASACWVWRPKHKVLDHGNPQQDFKDKGVIDSGCSRHMIGNRSYLIDYEEINGGFVAFGENSKGGKITRKDFKLTDENHVVLKVPRKDKMYSVDLKNVVPQEPSWTEALIEDWVSDSDEENVPKVKTVEMFNKSSFAKINFVESTEQVKSFRKISIDKNRQNTPSPRGNKRNWNQQMSQKLRSNFEMFNKACHVCGSFDHLKNDCKNWYNNGRSAKPVWTNVQRVNKQNFSKLTRPSPRRNMVPRTVLTSSCPISVNVVRPVNTV
ncbi:hypothetical protein Tco_0887212 [Tanacetum coccineum]